MNRKILFIDDDEDCRTMVAETLRPQGHEVLTAADASEAMRLMERAKLGLIILDLNLAGESGPMLMKFLKKNYPDVPVLIYTGLVHNQREIERLLMEGATQYLHKGPIEELLNAVKRSFRQHS
jgi:DNA-binding response OmpR family regulator